MLGRSFQHRRDVAKAGESDVALLNRVMSPEYGDEEHPDDAARLYKHLWACEKAARAASPGRGPA